MEAFDLAAIGLVGNLLVFLVCSLVVWFGGVRLAYGADALADKAGLGHAFTGILLLGAMVSLPEMTFSTVAAARGNAGLAVNGLLGGIGMTMVVVAITDFVVGREPLSLDIQRPVVMFQGVMVVLVLCIAAAGITTGDMPLPGVGTAGVWALALLGIHVFTIMVVRRIEPRLTWRPEPAAVEQDEKDELKAAKIRARLQHEEERGLPAIVAHIAFAAIAVVAAGTILAFSAEVLADQTGLGDSFVGFLFGGAVTTLPELSTMIAVARLGQYEMTFSDAFGTNLFSVGLIFLADVIYPGGPILNEVGSFSVFGVLLGAAMTAIYLAGIVVRDKRSVLRMGLDSHAVLIVALIGFGILYSFT